ncbi:hypothetical protein ACFOY5_20615 [Massilia aurea]|jgi:hypothetical protein|uniref:hypothetical protein n=1 Tax=Massilia aurea TaxID=373040 RepID=UPI002161CA21|nr:hypothetical protein [Massilia aurea]MCS0710046.1 hypothetical protein [Massilia aurea]
MEFITAIMDLSLAQIFVAGATLLIIFGDNSAVIEEEEDGNSDYENASWNPSSVNYNE